MDELVKSLDSVLLQFCIGHGIATVGVALMPLKNQPASPHRAYMLCVVDEERTKTVLQLFPLAVLVDGKYPIVTLNAAGQPESGIGDRRQLEATLLQFCNIVTSPLVALLADAVAKKGK